MNKNQEFINLALKQVGDDYVWGEDGPDEFDCSGLIVYCLKNIGLYFKDSTANTIYEKGCFHIERGDLKSSDLVFKFNGLRITHVGIYDNGSIIEAKGRAYGVIREPMKSRDWNRFGKLRILSKDDDIKIKRSEWYAVKVDTYLTLRENAGTSSDPIRSLYNTDRVKYLDDEKLEGNSLWFKIDYDGVVGWVASQYLRPVDEPVPLEPEPLKDGIYISKEELIELQAHLRAINDILK
jgi:hypothetical protein